MKENIELIICASVIGGGVIGAVITYFVKNNRNKSKIIDLQKKYDEILDENEKFRRKYDEAERHNEDFEAELEKLQRQKKSSVSDKEELQDELDDALKKIKKLTIENNELNRKIEEYKAILSVIENK